MVKLVRAAWMALFVAVSAVTASAQASLDVPHTLTSGNNVTVSYCDTTRAGQTIQVQIDDGTFPDPAIITITIQLNGQGKGSAQWTVPNWESAHFNAPGVREIARFID